MQMAINVARIIMFLCACIAIAGCAPRPTIVLRALEVVVIDSDGKPLAGVDVIVPGSTLVFRTDAAGLARLMVSAPIVVTVNGAVTPLLTPGGRYVLQITGGTLRTHEQTF
jgi:hypothetical protein